jgi:molecular chaperone GrpE
MNKDVKEQNKNNHDQKDAKSRKDKKGLEERIQELENNWKRALADYKNLERRVDEEKREVISFSNMLLISRLLPILDSLEMLEQHTIDTGLKLTSKQLKQVLEEEGLERINAEDKTFDPDTMDAMETVEGEEGKVVEVIQTGYKLKDKLIRPAKVKVGKSKEE